MKRYLGIDLHSNSFTVCYFKTEQDHYFKTYRLKPGGLRCFKQGLRLEDELAVEATGNTEYFLEQVRDGVSRCVVVSPRRFKLIRQSVSKTDENDARMLAFFLSRDLLPEARLKTRACVQVNSLCQSRDQLVKTRTRLLNKIHGLLNSVGIKLRKESLGTKRGLARVMSHELDKVMEIEISILVKQIRYLNESIKELEGEITRYGSQLTGYKNLVSIKGIGDRSAAVLLSVIGDIDDFASEEKLASYFGVVPKVRNSNETQIRGRITKRGSKLGRTTLVQCTLIAIRYSEYLRRFYERIKARRGSGKAIIAAAKKLLGIIYNTLKNNWIFEDFPNFVLANSSIK